MRPLDPSLLAWSASHHGTISSDAFRAAGYSVEQVKRLVSDHMIERLLDGTYRFTGAPPDEWARCVAACQRPGQLVLAGPTAGRWWGFRRMGSDLTVHVIAPPASHPSVEQWMRAYRTAAIAPVDIIDVGAGLRVTSVPRTVVDLSRFLSVRDLRSVIDQAISEKGTTASEIMRVVEPLLTPRRRWARTVGELVAQRPAGGAPESHWEGVVIRELLQHAVPVEAQYSTELPGFGRVRFDGAVPTVRWAVEIDGHGEHFTSEGAARDAERDAAATADGWLVTRVATPSLMADQATAISRVVAAYRRRAADHLPMRNRVARATHLSSEDLE